MVGRKDEGFTEAKAIAARNKLVSEALNGSDFTNKGKKIALTFDMLAVEYFEYSEVVNNLKSAHRSHLQYLKHIKEDFGNRPIILLSDRDMTRLQAKWQITLSDGSVKLLLGIVLSILGFGVKRGYIPISPFKNIRKPKLDNVRLRYLSTFEIDLIYRTINRDHLLMFVKIALATGARVETILNIQYKHIDFEQKMVSLEDFKRKMTYFSYFTEEFLDTLNKDSKPNAYLVSFKGTRLKYTTLNKQLKPILDKFNKELNKKDTKERVVIHTLRHTFASHLAINGVPLLTIQKLMNHSDIKMTMRYAKLAPDAGKEYLNDLYN